ncbi:MAG: hypothetical protein CMH75_01365 [Nitrospina sp.]|nr:hypothetical protein [Nitrospina sp.]
MNLITIFIIHDSNDQHPSWYEDLKKEGFTVFVFPSIKGIQMDNNPQIFILNSKVDNESSIKLIEKIKAQSIPTILCSEYGKDKMSFPIWASDMRVVKSGDYRDLKLTIQEALEQLKGMSNR